MANTPNRLREALSAEQSARILTISTPEQIEAITRYAPYAEAAELRGDLFPSQEPEYLAEQVQKVANHLGVLFTLRSKPEGGSWEGDNDSQVAITQAVMPHIDGLDVEFINRKSDHLEPTLVPLASSLVDLARRQNKVVIGSYHNFDPPTRQSDLFALLNKITRTGFADLQTDYVKLAIIANTFRLSRAVLHYCLDTTRARYDETICLGMGVRGRISRRLAIYSGLPATFITPVLPNEEGDPIDPAQLTYEEAERLIKQWRNRRHLPEM